MSTNTGIQWTDATWNPVVGCEPVSEGCDNCYAKQLHDMRHKAFLAGKKMLPQYAVPFETVQLKPERIETPLHWAKPRRVFVNSVSDLFHKDVPVDFLDRCFAVMTITYRHTYQILTKRPARMLKYMRELYTPAGYERLEKAAREVGYSIRFEGIPLVRAPLPNVWLGTSVEHQAAADKRIPMLLDTPAAVRFLSCEPLLGPLDLSKCLLPLYREGMHACRGVHWVIVGGESGARSRACLVYWISQIVDQCRKHDVPVFVKQFGKWIEGGHEGFIVNRWLFADGRVFVPPILGPRAKTRPDGAIAFGLCDDKGGNAIEWPERFRLREFPENAA